MSYNPYYPPAGYTQPTQPIQPMQPIYPMKPTQPMQDGTFQNPVQANDPMTMLQNQQAMTGTLIQYNQDLLTAIKDLVGQVSQISIIKNETALMRHEMAKRRLEESDSKDRAYSVIEQKSNMLCVPDKRDRLQVVLAKDFEAMYYVTFDPLFERKPVYLLKFPNQEKFFMLTEKEFYKTDSFLEKLQRESGVQIKNVVSRKKLASLLRDHIVVHATQIFIPFYSGWKKEEEYMSYNLPSRKKKLDMDSGLVSGNRQSVIDSASANLTAAKQILTVFSVIKDLSLRKFLCLWWHMAAIFSLLTEWGRHISLGLCLISTNPVVRKELTYLFQWFDYEPVRLDRKKRDFLQDLLRMKDQPLLVTELPAGVENGKILEQCVETVLIPLEMKDVEGYPELMALPTVVGDGSTFLGQSSAFITLEVTAEDMNLDKTHSIALFQKYFSQHIYGFCKYVENNILSDLKKYITKACLEMERQWAEDSLPLEHLELLGIFQGVRWAIRKYIYDLAMPCEYESHWSKLMGLPVDEEVMEILNESVENQCGCEEDVTAFFQMAKRLVKSGELCTCPVNISESENFPDDKAPAIFYDEKYASLNPPAFKVVLERLGVGSQTMVPQLRGSGYLQGGMNGTSTITTRISIWKDHRKVGRLSVYKFNRNLFEDDFDYSIFER